MTQPAALKSSRFTCLPALLSALLAATLYGVTIGGGYIYDDFAIIGQDKRIRDPRLWWQIWTRDYFNGGTDNLYRPLVTQSYAFQFWLQRFLPGLGQWSFHAVNILLHAVASALVAEMGRRMVNFRVGLIAGLLFACHPVHSEAVAGIVGRAELACTSAILGALLLFLIYPLTHRRALAIFALSVVAMLCKEQGMLMPLFLLALWPARQSLLSPYRSPAKSATEPPVASAFEPGCVPQLSPSPAFSGERDGVRGDFDSSETHFNAVELQERRPIQLLTALLTYTTGALIVLRETVLHLKFEWDRSFLDIAVQPMIKSPPLDRWLIPVALVGRYAVLLLAPCKLSIDYGLAVITPTISRPDPYLWIGGAAIALWLIATAISVTQKRWVPLSYLLAMGIAYSMASNVVIIGTVFGERLLYLPSAFFVLLIAQLIGQPQAPPSSFLSPALVFRKRARVGALLSTALVAVLIGLSIVRTFTYVRRWNDRKRFYEYSLAEQPKSLKIHMLVSELYYEQDRLAEAQRAMTDAEKIYPGYWELWKMSALIAERANDWESAVDYFKIAFNMQPSIGLQNAMSEATQKRDAFRAEHDKTKHDLMNPSRPH